MTTNKSFCFSSRKWTILPDKTEACLYKSDEKILIYRRVITTTWNGESIRRYGYGLRHDDCTHTKRYIYNAIRHYLYVKEILSDYGI